jgi:hypothetical protein
VEDGTWNMEGAIGQVITHKDEHFVVYGSGEYLMHKLSIHMEAPERGETNPRWVITNLLIIYSLASSSAIKIAYDLAARK